MDRLSGLDASFLSMETPAQQMHVCAVMMLDPETIPGGYEFGRFKAELERRVSGVPTFRRKLRSVPWEVDTPVWVDDADFTIDRHVHQYALPRPGGSQELCALVGELAEVPLDRRHPLWEMGVIEGLADGRLAVFTKMHHATVDGISGSNLISYLCSLAPDAPPIAGEAEATEERARMAGVPGGVRLLGRGVVRTLVKPWQLVQLTRETVGVIERSYERAREGAAMAMPFSAPRTSFNGTISRHRVVAFADLSLDRVRAIRSAIEGTTINDVVLAISGGALRRYLEERGELPSASLMASVPVSVHGRSQGSGTNKVSSLFARLGTDIADPVARLRRVASADASAKAHHDEIPPEMFQHWMHVSPQRALGLAMRMVAKLKLAERGPVIHNLVISNVPGPPMPLYFMGARVDALYPLGPVFHQAGLNITVISNDGKLHVGLIGCRRALPGLAGLAANFERELDALYGAVTGGPGGRDPALVDR